MADKKRLIDANAITNGIGLYLAENAYLNDTALDALVMVADWITNAPTVDAVEVVHGRLIPSIAKVDCTCSVCRTEFDNILSKALERWNYCPNYGAKMDGEEN